MPGRRWSSALRHPKTVQRSVVQRYLDAWESVDIPTMPPDPAVFLGRQEIVDLCATVPAAGSLDKIPLVPTRTNRQPAAGAYFPDPDAGVSRPYGVMVLAWTASRSQRSPGAPIRRSFRCSAYRPSLRCSPRN